ncbi:MAG: hypothetical protein PHW46_00700 [Candidatus Omnitrophica bacterium]|nr:hypothetical protein [Candidatus Omnitrophota bacterium]
MAKKSNRFLLILMYIIVAAVLCSLAVFYNLSRISIFFINRFTDCDVSCIKCSGNVLREVNISGFEVDLKKKGIKLTADKTRMKLVFKDISGEKCLILTCYMEGVGVSYQRKRSSAAGDATSKDILDIVFNPIQKYSEVSFGLVRSGEKTEINDFSAVSKDINIRGDYISFNKKDEVLVDFKFSFSPQIAGSFPDEMRKNLLSLDDSGWYSTVINYTGNPAFLRALYLISST